MERQYLVTERAHFMCPNMHFGMLFELKSPLEIKRIEETLDALSTAHPFLRAVLAYENDTNKLYYKITNRSRIQLSIDNDFSSLWTDYNQINTTSWNLFQEGMLKVFAYPKDSGMTVLLVAHHLLADGKGMLHLSEEFANYYEKGISPVFAQEQLIQSIDELPQGSALSGISKFLVNHANKQWKKENHHRCRHPKRISKLYLWLSWKLCYCYGNRNQI